MRLPNGYGSVYKLSGKRRKPFIVKKTLGYHVDHETGRSVRDDIIIGYAETKAEGLQMLASYNDNPYDVKTSKMTFKDLYEEWSERAFKTASEATISADRAAFNACAPLHDKRFIDLKAKDFQYLFDTTDKNHPTMRKMKILISKMYKYAMKYDYVSKDYSQYIDISQYKDKNPNQYDRQKFTEEEVMKLWEHQDNPICQTALMLIYSGVRIGELLDLKKEDVHLEERYFDVVSSKTQNGIRKVPIAEKVYPFYKSWFEDTDSEYLIHRSNGEKFKYDNYHKKRFQPLMEQLGMDHTPHCCRYTCSSMMHKAEIRETIRKKILGHSQDLINDTYTQLDIDEIVNAINLI